MKPRLSIESDSTKTITIEQYLNMSPAEIFECKMKRIPLPISEYRELSATSRYIFRRKKQSEISTIEDETMIISSFGGKLTDIFTTIN